MIRICEKCLETLGACRFIIACFLFFFLESFFFSYNHNMSTMPPCWSRVFSLFLLNYFVYKFPPCYHQVMIYGTSCWHVIGIFKLIFVKWQQNHSLQGDQSCQMRRRLFQGYRLPGRIYNICPLHSSINTSGRLVSMYVPKFVRYNSLPIQTKIQYLHRLGSGFGGMQIRKVVVTGRTLRLF